RRATSGLPAMTRLTVAMPDGGRVTVDCPDRVDVMPEVVALAVDTVARIRDRFPVARQAVSQISFDHSEPGLRESQWSGLTHLNLAAIYLNASLASAGGLVAFQNIRAADPTRRPPATVPAPATYVDGVTAHESWHRMEMAFEARSYRESIGFRRRLGEHFGVATLEHAVLGGGPAASSAWRAAHERLVAEVSAYGGTSPREATAELFKLWWCWPDAAWSPAVRRFDELLATLPL
ncbi:MAG: hypothetical protein ACRD12_20150, partial [Acidimicrobiales bacterium]